MPWVTVEFIARFNSSNAEVPRFVAQITRGTPGDKLPIIQQYIPELDLLVWNDTSKKFVGVLSFNTDNYDAVADQDWKNPDGSWNFKAEVPQGNIKVPRAAWTIIRMITDRIFCVPVQTRNGPLWSPVTGKYELVADEVSEFASGGGDIGNGGWGGMQHAP